jgi:hypothetical protein
MVTYEFLYLPESPILMLGMGLLTYLGSQITFTQGGPTSPMVREPNALIMEVTMPTEGDAASLPGRGEPEEAHLPARGVS